MICRLIDFFSGRIKFKPLLFLAVMCLLLASIWVPQFANKLSPPAGSIRKDDEAQKPSLSADMQEKIDSLIKTYSQKAKGGDTQAQYRLGGFYCREKVLPGCSDDPFALVRAYDPETKTFDMSKIKNETPEDICDAQQQYYIKYRTHDYCKNEGLPLLYSAAEKGDIDAQYSLGRMFEDSELIPHDDKESLKWYLAAASHDNDAKYKNDYGYSPVVSSMGNVARFYEQGRGTPKDDAKAFEWYLKAAQHGDVDAYSNVAHMLKKGIGTKQDIPQAISWFKKIHDNALAEYELAETYMVEGNTLPESYSNAFELLNKLRNECIYGWNGGISTGCFNRFPTAYFLGVLYGQGHGVARDYKAAADYFLEAANGGIREAQYNLGWLYYKGQGVLKDYKKSYMWYDLAAANGYEAAAPVRDELEKYWGCPR